MRNGKGKGKAINKRRKPGGGGGRPLLALALVAGLIALVFFFLEYTRDSVTPAPPTASAPPAPVPGGVAQTPRLKLPARPAAQPRLSSASLPAQKPKAALAPRGTGAGTVAIIVDDMGSSMGEARALISIKLPLTFSVIPSLARAKGVAQAAHDAGGEVMLHLPMEPRGYPRQPLEKIGLLLSMSDAEIEQRVQGYFGLVPFAVGANNHMGSRFTEDAGKMDVVLRVLQGKGLFFVDSRTSPVSVAYARARALGLRCATRQVFLDNVQDEALIGKQLAEAVAIARKRGVAIAICHPHPATIRALQALMPKLAREGITFVYASKIV